MDYSTDYERSEMGYPSTHSHNDSASELRSSGPTLCQLGHERSSRPIDEVRSGAGGLFLGCRHWLDTETSLSSERASNLYGRHIIAVGHQDQGATRTHRLGVPRLTECQLSSQSRHPVLRLSATRCSRRYLADPNREIGCRDRAFGPWAYTAWRVGMTASSSSWRTTTWSAIGSGVLRSL